MRQKIYNWLGQKNEAYSQLAQMDTTNGMIILTAAVIVGGILTLGMLEAIGRMILG